MPTLINAGQSPFGFHRIHTFMTCPTKYYNSYVSNDEKPLNTSSSLIIGCLVHTALAHRYAIIKAKQENKLHDYYYPIDAIQAQAQQEGGEWLNWIDKSIRAYETYINADTTIEFEKDLKILDVETVYEISIADIVLTFRADLTIEKDNKFYFIDHKTCAYMTDIATDGYEASGQLLAYILYGRKQFHSIFGGMYINFIAHGGQRSEKMSTKFVKVAESEDHLNNFEDSVYFYAKQIKSLEDKSSIAYPRVQSEFTCVHKYGKCQYYDKCFGSKQN